MKKNLFRAICLVLVAITMFSLCSCGDFEEEEVKYASAVPQSKEEIFNYFCAALQKVQATNPAISYDVSCKAKSPECENSNIKAAFPTIAGLMTNGTKAETKYGEDCAAVFKGTTLQLLDIKSANIVDINNTTSKSYTIVLKIWEEANPTQDNSIFGRIYKLTDKKEILKEFEKASAYITADDFDTQYSVGTITAVISKDTDQITELHLDRAVQVSTEITGQNTLASIGTVPLSFRYESTENYSFNWEDPNAEPAAEE